MKPPTHINKHKLLLCLIVTVSIATITGWADNNTNRPGVIRCAKLVYGNNKKTPCFATKFLVDAQRKANINTHPKLDSVKLESRKLFNYPFIVWGGEDLFRLTSAQRNNLKKYIDRGGFMIVSANCTSKAFDQCFRREFKVIFPKSKLKKLPMSHPVFHTVYDIDRLKTSRKKAPAHLEAMIIDGRVAMIYSTNGLSDTDNAGGNCCCCGGNEIANARQVNVNLLIYALTH